MSQTFEECFKNHHGDKLCKWTNYPKIYDRFFSKFRHKNPVILEIGIRFGGSIQVWNTYFDHQCQIYAVDISKECKNIEKDNVKVFIGDQANKNFLNKIKEKSPKFDIIVDDGGHKMNQQIISFEELYEHLNYGGVYLCEDTHTSYMKKYNNGGVKTFIQHMCKKVDQLHAWFSEDPTKFKVNKYTKNIECITFYNSVVIIEKEKQTKPKELRAGKTILQAKLDQ